MFDFALVGASRWVFAKGTSPAAGVYRVHRSGLELVAPLEDGECRSRCRMLATDGQLFIGGARSLLRMGTAAGRINRVMALDAPVWSLAQDGEWLIVSTRHERTPPPIALSHILRVHIATYRVETLWSSRDELMCALGVTAASGRVFFMMGGQHQTSGVYGISLSDRAAGLIGYARVSPYINAVPEHITSDGARVYWAEGALRTRDHERAELPTVIARRASAVQVDGGELFWSAPGAIHAVPIPSPVRVPAAPRGRVVQGPGYRGLALHGGAFALTDALITRLEARLAPAVAAHPDVHRAAVDYTSEYRAYDEDGQRVRVTLHCEPGPDWVARGLPSVRGGGDCYLTATYVLADDRIESLRVSSGR